MSNTCQESMETSSTRVPYLSSLGLERYWPEREREGKVLKSSNNKNKIKKKGVAPYLLESMLIKTWQHLRQTHDAKKKNAFKTNKKDNPCWGYKQSGEGIRAKIHQLQL